MASKPLSVIWSVTAEHELHALYQYLVKTWSKSIADRFLERVLAFEEALRQMPEMCAASLKHPDCRRGLLHPHISLIYKIDGDAIRILAIHDNRSQN